MEINRRIKSKKLNTRVDLTAMVSVSFLLIIFFMLVGELSKPKIMDLSLPDNDPIWDGVTHCGAGMDDRAITVLLDNNNRIVTYSGILGYSDEAPKEFKYVITFENENRQKWFEYKKMKQKNYVERELNQLTK